MPASRHFTPVPASADRSLFRIAVLLSLALHLLLLASASGLLPTLPDKPLPVSSLQVTLLKTPPAPRPQRAEYLAQHDSQGNAVAEARPQAGSTSPVPVTTGTLGAPLPAADEHAPATPDQPAAANPAALGVSWASYVENWRHEVERIGNRHYPAQARELGLSGSLELIVTLAADGSLLDVRVSRSSGHAILDEAAIDIVRLGAPYPPFPPRLAQSYRSLQVVRKWSFTAAHRLDGGTVLPSP